MGICHGSTKNNNGQLKQVMAKVRKSQDIDIILKETTETYTTYNPYMNPILNRRLREQSTPTYSNVQQ
ncbi:unnamed protein product (macronuclear) [Paramecium tetraurelia]|uniref:Uncharacterized protein n=2 Tax=Paramecium TaxID=5884 RepID=A0E7G6_PARTE|nr:uncharacterized protein GSPATT00023961001 [Paramecium tetraurelia]CAD8183909.1 unnamed protein product [Paramecium octaurelia]CAK91233.1 unnamed protein product [Paramecium tetraurelia]|eukprot:XP_001458630.1 hypothetical protein (macronuclear) [Paramecium tetraurelia strain d4-2]